MIKERFYFGFVMIIAAVAAYFFITGAGVLNTFLGGAVIVGLIVGGLAYIVFAFETSDYIKSLEGKKK